MKNTLYLFGTMFCANALLHSNSDRWHNLMEHYSKPVSMVEHTRPIDTELKNNLANFRFLAQKHLTITEISAPFLILNLVPIAELLAAVYLETSNPKTSRMLIIAMVTHFYYNITTIMQDEKTAQNIVKLAKSLIQNNPLLLKQIQSSNDPKLMRLLQNIDQI